MGVVVLLKSVIDYENLSNVFGNVYGQGHVLNFYSSYVAT